MSVSNKTSTPFDLVNLTFGEWTVLERDTTVRKYKAKYWICKCSCGLIKSVIGRDLLSNISTKCRKCQGNHKRKYGVENLKDKIYGEWSVLHLDEIHNRKGAYWVCRCSCGLIKSVRAKDLRHGISKGCVSCGHNKLLHYVDNCIPDWVWNQLQHSAKRRNIEISISKDYCLNILKQQNFKCKLSGMLLYISKNWTEHRKSKTTASIDRIDSNKGYIMDNIQWVHKDINFIKQNYNQEYFINLCKLVYITSDQNDNH